MMLWMGVRVIVSNNLFRSGYGIREMTQLFGSEKNRLKRLAAPRRRDTEYGHEARIACCF
jgi:hypothetical protein